MTLGRHVPRLATVVLVVCACVAGGAVRADSLEAIPLKHRLAEDLIPILQPLMPPGAALTGAGDVLLVRADEATLRNVRQALVTLDRAPRQLLITVGQSSGTVRQSAGVRGTATIGTGDAEVGVNRPPGAATGADVTVHGAATRDDIRNVSSVRALEGREAYVAIGETRPFTSTTVVTAGPRGHGYGETTEYRAVQSGFHATPRLLGDRVTLEITPMQQRASGATRSPAIGTGSLTTTVSGRLGEWIELGGTAESGQGSSRGLIIWGTRSELTQYSAWVKVEEVR
jgi:type II secretory pathway component GspD/PulD (secretin)